MPIYIITCRSNRTKIAGSKTMLDIWCQLLYIDNREIVWYF